MLIRQAARECKLTKKAIEYYEAKGLLAPAVLENGYRDYGEADIQTLKEIAVLRQCGLRVADIKGILRSNNKAAALAKCRHVAQLGIDRLRAAQRRADKLIRDYDVEAAFAALPAQDEELLTIREKLTLAFPGNYGIFLSLHFGRFLDGVVDTEEKRGAYREIVDYLDGLELHIPPELAEFLEEAFSPGEGEGVARLEHSTNDAMLDMLENPEDYLTRHRAEIEAYHEFLRSDAYADSPVAAMQQKLREFQTQSGYRDKLVENMKRLSPSYAEYFAKLQAADEQFFKLFPYSADLYEQD